MTGALLTALCGPVQAEEQGFYAGSGAGLYYVDLDGVDFDETAPSLRLFGGYKLNDYVSFEAGYTNLFKASDRVSGVDFDLDGDAWDVSVRPTLPIADTFKAFGILGWSHYQFDVSADAGDGLSISDSDSDDDLIYGVGGELTVNDNWNVRGEWTVVNVSDADFGMFSVSAVYTFR